MTLRRAFSSDTIDELERVVRNNIRRINNYAKMQGLPRRNDWQQQVSEECLLRIQSSDVSIATEDKNLFDFSFIGITQSLIHIRQ
jgi:hypothetical protein